MNIIDEYINNAILIEEMNNTRIKKSNVNRYNKLAQRMRKIAQIIDKDYPELKSGFADLLYHNSQTVRIWCAHHILEVMRYSDIIQQKAIKEIMQRAVDDYGEKLWLDKWKASH